MTISKGLCLSYPYRVRRYDDELADASRLGQLSQALALIPILGDLADLAPPLGIKTHPETGGGNV